MPTRSKSKSVKVLKKDPPAPAWLGLHTPDAGVTQSIGGGYLADKERFRLKMIEGLKPVAVFSPPRDYGSIWHICEEYFAETGNYGDEEMNFALRKYCKTLSARFPTSGEQITKWYNVAKVQFPIYCEWWKKHPDIKNRTPLLQEEVFCVPYILPSGRVVWLCGRLDSVDIVKNLGVVLQENKTKSDIKKEQLSRQLKFDWQTMVYVTVLETLQQLIKNLPVPHPGINADEIKPDLRMLAKLKGFDQPVAAVRYNVIRRPLGSGSIRPHKEKKTKNTFTPAETDDEFYARLGEVIKNAWGPEVKLRKDEHSYFARWNTYLCPGDISKFKTECLNPVLENLSDDYQWWKYCKLTEAKVAPCSPYNYHERATAFPLHINRHFRMPYGLWNPLLEDASGDLDHYLETGSETGLQRVSNDQMYLELIDE